MNIAKNYPLNELNTFGVSANARYFASITDIENLQALLSDKQWQRQPKFVLGGGSNILLTKNYDGLIIYNQLKGINLVNEDDDHIWLKLASGENWHQAVLYCVEHGYAGIENLSFIPGTVGAAPIQNIGAYGAEFKDVFEELSAVDLKSGKYTTFNNKQCRFGYRDSIFKHQYKNQFFICDVTLRLSKKLQPNINYHTLAETLKQQQSSEINIKSISEAVINIRKNKLPDPNKIGNAGSFFKNPMISATNYQRLQMHFPQMPSYIIDKENIKIPAAWLIEQCGYKGRRIGKVGTYEKQSLVIVNYGCTHGQEIHEFSKNIQQSVFEKFEIELQPEVVII